MSVSGRAHEPQAGRLRRQGTRLFLMLPVVFLLAAVPRAPAEPSAIAQGRYLMLLDGVPAGVIAWRVEGAVYTYRSTHLYRARSRTREVVLKLGGRTPEVLALSTLRAVGCVDAVEELTLRQERVCVDAVQGRHVRGRIDAALFAADYDDGGRLERLEVVGAVFVASTAALGGGGDPFGQGFPVTGQGTTVAFSPALEGARAASPRGGGDEAGVDGGASCLELARARAKGDPALEVVVGLVVENDRAWPHAWLAERKTGAAIDPSVLPGDSVLTHRRYVSLPTERAGAVYLELLAGTRKVVLSR